MSHRPERKENDCLNCGAVVYGKFCHVCGQENTEPKETFWGLLTHFVYDVTHFDGKFFSTVKYLLLKPGFLSSQYIKGRRNNYLNPIRMYVFTSAIFFLFFFSVNKPDNIIKFDETNKKAHNLSEVKRDLLEEKSEIEEDRSSDYISKEIKAANENKLQLINKDLERLKTDTTHLNDLNFYQQNLIENNPGNNNVVEYKATQARLPVGKKDGWLKRSYHLKKFELEEKYGKNPKVIQEKVIEKFLHSFPQLFFVSLPLFALLLKLIYIRRKNFFYGDHAIYSIHLYCAGFIFIFLTMSLSRLSKLQHLHWLEFVGTALSLYIVYYAYKSLRNFYKQSRVKTIFKLIVLWVLSFALLIILFIVFFILSTLML